MTASDYLDGTKRRMLRLGLPDFAIYDTFSGLLGVHLTDVMSDSPDVRIGDLVVPELTLTLSHTDLSSLSGASVTAESGIEAAREDVSAQLAAIYAASGSGTLVYARSASGCWIVADGRNVYGCRFTASGSAVLTPGFESTAAVTGLHITETALLNSDGHVGNNNGTLYLAHGTEPYLTRIGFIGYTYSAQTPGGFDFDSTEQTVTITSPLYAAVVRDLGADLSCNRITFDANGQESPDPALLGVRTDMLTIRSRAVYRSGELHRSPVSGEVTRYVPDSYGTFVMREMAAQDEETDEVRLYGLLGEAAYIPAADFFRSGDFVGATTFAELYTAFLGWLSRQGLTLTAVQQSYLNLSDLRVTAPDQTADFSGVTASDILRGLAALEGGNARLDKSGRLLLGWCGDTPVLTVSAESLSALRIGTEAPRAAQDIDLRAPDGKNVIATGQQPEQMWMRYLLDSTELDTACDRIVAAVDNRHRIPVTADLLEGAGPLLRAGDCIRLVTRSGGVLVTELMQQDVDAFPHMEARITTPDHTSWDTYTVDYEDTKVIGLTVTGWPAFVVSGYPPDTSGMAVTANCTRTGTESNDFIVDPALYSFSYTEQPAFDRCGMRVSFAGTQQGAYAALLYPLTAAGEPLLTAGGSVLAVTERST